MLQATTWLSKVGVAIVWSDTGAHGPAENVGVFVNWKRVPAGSLVLRHWPGVSV